MPVVESGIPKAILLCQSFWSSQTITGLAFATILETLFSVLQKSHRYLSIEKFLRQLELAHCMVSGNFVEKTISHFLNIIKKLVIRHWVRRR